VLSPGTRKPGLPEHYECGALVDQCVSFGREGSRFPSVLAICFRRGQDDRHGWSQVEGNGQVGRHDGGAWWGRVGRCWEFDDDE
jgi:hypothetical protein